MLWPPSHRRGVRLLGDLKASQLWLPVSRGTRTRLSEGGGVAAWLGRPPGSDARAWHPFCLLSPP